jgi:hypothetical protein
MELAYKMHGNVLMEHKVEKNDGFDAGQNESTSYEKPEVQTIA